MERTFSIIAIITILMTALTGAGVFYLSQTSDNKIKEDAVHELAKGIAQNISTRTQLLTQSLRNIAQSPELVQALKQADFSRAKAQVQLMSAYLPDAIAFRLLFPADNKPDNSIIPHMGYADLELVKDTFQKSQHPLIQGERGEHRHLALTHGIVQEGQVIAVILASVDFQGLQKSFNRLTDKQLYIELKQADFVLFSYGKEALKSLGQQATIKVKDTAWTVSYWYHSSLDLTLIEQILGIILIPAFIAGLACYLGCRKLQSLLIEDQHSILKATKDLILGQMDGNYPVKLQTMRNFISSIIQFKRENDYTNNKIDLASPVQITETPSQEPQFPGIEVKNVDSGQGASSLLY